MTARPDQGLPRAIQRLKADLRANPRKRFILIALLPVMIVVWVPVLKGGSSSPAPPRPEKTPTSSLGEETVAPPISVDFELRGQLGKLVGGLDMNWRPSWEATEGEHPFGMPVDQAGEDERLAANGDPRQRVAPGSKEDEEARLAATLYPTSTFLSEKYGDVAIIGGFPYRTGEEIEHFVIQEIKTREVVLKGHHGVYELGIPLEQKRRPLRNKERR